MACSKTYLWPWQSVEALQNKGLVKTLKLNTVSYHCGSCVFQLFCFAHSAGKNLHS